MIKDIRTAISNWRRLPERVKEVITSANSISLPAGGPLDFHKDGRLIGSASVNINVDENFPHPLFRDVADVEISHFFVRDESGKPVDLMGRRKGGAVQRTPKGARRVRAVSITDVDTAFGKAAVALVDLHRLTKKLKIERDTARSIDNELQDAMESLDTAMNDWTTYFH